MTRRLWCFIIGLGWLWPGGLYGLSPPATNQERLTEKVWPWDVRVRSTAREQTRLEQADERRKYLDGLRELIAAKREQRQRRSEAVK